MRRVLAGAWAGATLLAACSSGGRTPQPDPIYASDAVAGCDHGPGRTGQGDALIPKGSISVRICSMGSTLLTSDRPRHTVTELRAGSALGHLQAVLNRGRLNPPVMHQCDAGGMARVFTLDFRYVDGPEVSVDIGPDCHPSITNGSVATDNWMQVVPAIDTLMGVRCGGLIC